MNESCLFPFYGYFVNFVSFCYRYVKGDIASDSIFNLFILWNEYIGEFQFCHGFTGIVGAHRWDGDDQFDSNYYFGAVYGFGTG